MKVRGFTLIEVMIVMAVIGILMGMVLYGLGKAQAAARDAGREQIMTGIQAALERYYGDKGYYPVGTTSNISRFCELTCVFKGEPIAAPWEGAGYLSDYPVDPGTKQGICGDCTTVGTSCTGDFRTPTCGGATYQYISPGNCQTTTWGDNACQTYQLTLQKESGGQSVFNSPN